MKHILHLKLQPLQLDVRDVLHMTIDAIWSTRGLFAFVPGTILDVLNPFDRFSKTRLSYFIKCNNEIGLSLLTVVRSLVERAE